MKLKELLEKYGDREIKEDFDIESILKEEPTYKRWRGEHDDVYYVIDSFCEIDCMREKYNKYSEVRYKKGNYFKTREEAEKERDKRIAIVRVNDRIDELNEGWEPNWLDENYKYMIYYDDYIDVCGVETTYRYKFPYAIKYIKTEEISKQIIKEMKEDLKLIFEVE